MAAKDSGLRIRVERPLREAFLKACRDQDKPAAQVIREFMRGYVARRTSDLAATPTTEPGKQAQRDRKQYGR
jgi:hypothetical protein